MPWPVKVGGFVSRNLEATWFIGLIVAGLLFVVLTWMLKDRPCGNTEKWPYNEPWWPGETARDLTPEERRDRCAE